VHCTVHSGNKLTGYVDRLGAVRREGRDALGPMLSSLISEDRFFLLLLSTFAPNLHVVDAPVH
jgi:hypothetical protein